MKYLKYLFLLILLFPITAQAVGVEIKPSSLNILYPDNKTSNISIRNISQEPIFVTAQADHFGANIKIKPAEFQLLPDELIKLEISNNFAKEKEGVKNTYISIVSKPLDRQSFNAASGIKIPMTINISESRWKWSGSAVFVISFLFLLLLVVIIKGIMSLFEIPIHKPKWHINLLEHHKKPWYRRIFRR